MMSELKSINGQFKISKVYRHFEAEAIDWCMLHIKLQCTTKGNIVRILLVSIHYIHLGLFRSIWLCWGESNFLLRLIKRRLDSEKVIKIKVQDNYQVLGVWSETNRSKRQSSKSLCLPNIGLVTTWQLL